MDDTVPPSSFESRLVESWPPAEWREVSVLIAVSGGADSVALLRALAAIKRRNGGPGRLMVGHFNHRLQPQASDDARFVAELAKNLELPLKLGEANVAKLATEQGDGIEAAARAARYSFLQQAAQQIGARYVATAHTADDQVETVLFNILRGTGLSGLAGMPRVRPLGPAVMLIRPLLSVSRCELISYLAGIQQDFRTDPTNSCADYSRNRIRHELLPRLRRDFNRDIDGALSRLAQLAGDSQRVLEKLADDLLERCVISTGAATGCELDTSPLATVDRHLIRQMFVALWRRESFPVQQMGFAEWEQLASMAAMPPGEAIQDVGELPTKRIFSGGVMVERKAGVMHIWRRFD